MNHPSTDSSHDSPQNHRSGFVALIGRPNVGKSTLMNKLVGEPIAITAHRPQTTRTRLRGILNRPDSQITFVDTPGLHQQDRAINRFMMEEAKAALSEVDLAVVLVEAIGRGKRPDEHEEDRLVMSLLKEAGCMAILAINKIDLLKEKSGLLPIMEAYDQTGLFGDLVPVSAARGEGLEELLVAIEQQLPIGPPFFPADMITDASERQLAGEFIREQAILRMTDELPYSLAVAVEHFEDASDTLTRIFAILYVERDSQKGILIGKGGSMLRQIGAAARKKIERLLGRKVYLDLRVKVAKRWPHTADGLSRVGYDKS